MTNTINITIILVVISSFITFVLLKQHFQNSWKATITPLASIIGSGFLVVGPMLAKTLNQWALMGMIIILCVALLIGQVIAFNIKHVEPLLLKPHTKDLVFIEDISKWSLITAYIISVAFYIRLLISFLTHNTFLEHVTYQNGITTLILVFIALVGWFKKLDGLEGLEDIAVKIKLSIIFGFIMGLVIYKTGTPSYTIVSATKEPIRLIDVMPILAGMLLVVQGFETSRYLGHKYPAELRIKTMRTAQGITAFIYILFIALATSLFLDNPDVLSETAIIEVSREVSVIMPILLLTAAAMSQLSAAIADTAGSGGLIQEISKDKLKPRIGYIVTASGAIILIWLTDIFSIVAIASKAFALYYLTQSIITARTILVYDGNITNRKLNLINSYCCMFILLYVILFSKPIS